MKLTVSSRSGSAAALFLLSLCLAATSAGAQSGAIAGRASVIDGDTIEIRGQRIRLEGIDAPEVSQRCQDEAGVSYRCGRDAAFFLDDLLKGKTVECEALGRDRYDRILGSCVFVSGGQAFNANATMVNEGHALAYRRYSKAYIRFEDAAKRAKRGMWRGHFVTPWDWRRRN